MRILHVIASVDTSFGGPIEGIIRQGEILLARGHQRDIVSLDLPGAEFLTRLSNVYPLGTQGPARAARRSWMPWKYYLYSSKLIPWLRENAPRYDVVVINGVWNYSAYAASRALRDLSVPYFVFTHGMLDPWFRRTYPLKHIAKQMLWLFSEGLLLRDAACVLFTTEEEAKLARGEFWGYRYTECVISYGTADIPDYPAKQTAAFYEALPILKKRPFLLFLGRIHRKKGCDLLIKAFKEIASASELDLVMAGPDHVGLQPRLARLAEQLGIASRVHWVGMLSGDVKFGAFRAAEAFVLPSHQENFGIAVTEAMASAKPVLITNKVNIWREVYSAGAGLVCDDTSAAVTNMLRTFIQMNPSARTKMGVSARKTFLQNFEVTAAALAFEKLAQDQVRTHTRNSSVKL